MNEPAINLTSYYFDSIELLRSKGDIILHSAFIEPSEDEIEYVTDFLRSEYVREAVFFPGNYPEFDPAAASWAARTVYIAAQLLLLRDISEDDFNKLLPDYNYEISSSSILSADLCLRFLPHIIAQAADINTYDGLIEKLDAILKNWPYSGIGRRQEDNEGFSLQLESNELESFRILFAERISLRKAEHRIPMELKEFVKPFINKDLNE